MKRTIKPALFTLSISVIALSSAVILSSLRKPVPAPTSLSAAEMSAVVDNAFKDARFAEITDADVKRFLTTHVNPKGVKPVDTQKWNELAKKKKFTAAETDFAFSVAGFKGAGDFKNYIDLLIALGKKFGVNKMTREDQQKFFLALFKKQHDMVRKDSLLQKKYKVLWPSQMPPECWKCVYDYRDCVNGTDGDWVIGWQHVTTYTEKTYVYRGGAQYYMETSYTFNSNPTLVYMNPSSPYSCTSMYQMCIGTCMIP